MLDDRVKAEALELLAGQLRTAQSGPFRQYLFPFVHGLALVIDRLDRYGGTDPDFVTSIRDELLDVLARHGITSIWVPEDGEMFDPHRHEAVRAEARDTPPGRVLAALRRGYAHGDWVFRPAQVLVAAEPGLDAFDSPAPMDATEFPSSHRVAPANPEITR